MDITLKRTFYYLSLFYFSLVLPGCGQIKDSTELTIEGMPILDTFLVVEETYTEGKNNEYMLPKGIYYPSRLVYGDMLRYYSLELISVGFFLLPGSSMCEGGIMVNIRKPYEKHVMFTRNCQADSGFIVNLKRKIQFKIVHASSLEKSPWK